MHQTATALALLATLLLSAAPASAAERPPTAAERDVIERAMTGGFAERCGENPGDPERGSIGAGQRAITAYAVAFPERASDGPVEATLFEALCRVGAYHLMSVWFLDRGEGPAPLAFATPVLDVRYVDRNWERLDSVAIVSWRAETGVVDATFDPQSLRLETVARWRGLGDAFQRSVYALEDGAFMLERFEVDPTYDGEIDAVVLFERGVRSD